MPIILLAGTYEMQVMWGDGESRLNDESGQEIQQRLEGPKGGAGPDEPERTTWSEKMK